MARPKFVQIPPQPLDRYRDLLGEGYEEVEEAASRARLEFAGRAIWHVSSTLRGGGVAEILHSLLPYVRGAGIDTRWVVLRESDEFFAVTKRLHNQLHGDPGDGGELGDAERRVYGEALAESGSYLSRLVQPGDVVYLHDPQTAGLASTMRRAGAGVVWRCHVGVDRPNDLTRNAWDFLRPFVAEADAYIFSREAYAWDGLERGRVWIMAPSIDAFCAKNQELDREVVEGILRTIGLRPDGSAGAPCFTRADGTPGRVERAAEIIQEAPLPDGALAVTQVSRWDRLKDPRGVLECFAKHLSDPHMHLVLAGPATGAVADDPEGAAVLAELEEAWRALPGSIRSRAHLVSLPMNDLEENGAMVNAIQRRADVIVQKSVAEGFGLVVAEAMWKERPVVASRVGGIQDQIVDGESGVLVGDPHDLEAFGREIRALASDPARAARIGTEARSRVMERYLGIHRLIEYIELVARLSGGAPRRTSRSTPRSRDSRTLGS